MIDPVIGAAFWLLALQGTGPSASPVNILPRYYKTEAECAAQGESLKKKFWVVYVCIPPGGVAPQTSRLVP